MILRNPSVSGFMVKRPPHTMKTFFTLLAAMLLCSCSTFRERAYSTEIQKVLTADRTAHVQAFQRRNIDKLPPRTAPLIIMQYTAAMRQIDCTKAPTDFRVAYLEHIQAWEGMAEEMKRRPEAGDLGTLLGVGMALAHSHPLAALGSIAATELARTGSSKSELKRIAHDRIRETWNKVELAAAQHGVSIPQ